MGDSIIYKMRTKFIKQFGWYLLIAIVVIFVLFPIIWIFMISIKTQRDAFAMPPVWIYKPIWKNYIDVWTQDVFSRAFVNSFIVTMLGVLIAMVAAIPAAYMINEYSFKGKRAIELWMLLSYMFPQFLFIIPIYLLYQKIGLYDTRIGLAIIYQVAALPFFVWLVRSFFNEVPKELRDAAKIDGCNQFQILYKIYVPLAAPGIAATAILTAIYIWNELVIALSLTFSNSKTVSVAISGFRGYTAINWGAMTAASIITIIPMFIFALLAQKYIVKGLTLGAIK